MLRGEDHLYLSALQIVNTVAVPSWITGEAAGWCLILSYCNVDSSPTGDSSWMLTAGDRPPIMGARLVQCQIYAAL